MIGRSVGYAERAWKYLLASHLYCLENMVYIWPLQPERERERERERESERQTDT